MSIRIVCGSIDKPVDLSSVFVSTGRTALLPFRLRCAKEQCRMIIDDIRSGQNGNQQAVLDLIKKFYPALSKYAWKLGTEDAYSSP